MLCVFKQLRREERERGGTRTGDRSEEGSKAQKDKPEGSSHTLEGAGRALAPLPPRRLLKTLWSGPQPSQGEVGARGSYFLWCY